MILPVLKNFTIGKGAGFDYRWQWNQGVPTSAVPTNLNLYNSSLAITNWNVSTTYMTLTNGQPVGRSGLFFGGATGDFTNGIIDIVITGTDTAAITWTTARYTLGMTLASGGSPLWLLYGTFSVIGSLP